MNVNTTPNISLNVPSQLTPGNVTDFEDKLSSVLRNCQENIAMDCSALEFVTSSHINLLWAAHLQCADDGITMYLQSPTAGLIRVLKVLDLYDVFEYTNEGTFAVTSNEKPVFDNSLRPSYRDHIPADRESIDKALIDFMNFLSGGGLPELTEFELRTIFYEVTTNIRLHSGISEKDRMEFTVKVGDRRIILEFIDSGMPFDITSQNLELEPRLAGQRRQKRGIGLNMVHKLADRVSYTRQDNSRNIVAIEKHWE
ncbi:MAG: STAS domain-containing protein [FCB group bacterium]|nr:STAS domain-containing protein [FCB group bacterium]